MPGCGCTSQTTNSDSSQTRTRSSSDEWLLESSSLKIALQLFQNGKISTFELEQIGE
jgi:hypothetical protein